MKTLITLLLVLFTATVSASAQRGVGTYTPPDQQNQSQGKAQIRTIDDRVIYKDGQLMSVQKQIVCDKDGKNCHQRGVAGIVK